MIPKKINHFIFIGLLLSILIIVIGTLMNSANKIIDMEIEGTDEMMRVNGDGLILFGGILVTIIIYLEVLSKRR